MLAVGFVLLLLWQAVVVGTGEKTSHRVSAAVKAVAAAALAVSCLRFATGGGSSSGNQQQTLTQRVLEAPGGPVLLVVAGLAVVAVGVVTAVKGIKHDFEDKVEGSLSPGLRRLGVAGAVARGVAFAVIGVLVAISSTGDTGKSRAWTPRSTRSRPSPSARSCCSSWPSASPPTASSSSSPPRGAVGPDAARPAETRRGPAWEGDPRHTDSGNPSDHRSVAN